MSGYFVNRLYYVLDTVVISDDDVYYSVVFSTLDGVLCDLSCW